MPAKALRLPTASDDAPAVARKVGLRYVDDSKPGITRKKTATGFRYLAPDGKPVRDEDELKRIRSLVIPPAWTGVWICPHANGHSQASHQQQQQMQPQSIQQQLRLSRLVKKKKCTTRTVLVQCGKKATSSPRVPPSCWH